MKALLVIDMVVDFIDPKGALFIGPVAEELVPQVKKRLENYRSEGFPVLFLCDRHIEDDVEFELFPSHSVQGSGGDQVVSEWHPGLEKELLKKGVSVPLSVLILI